MLPPFSLAVALPPRPLSLLLLLPPSLPFIEDDNDFEINFDDVMGVLPMPSFFRDDDGVLLTLGVYELRSADPKAPPALALIFFDDDDMGRMVVEELRND